MRQSDHVSMDLGSRLKAAGLQWDPQVGDWMAIRGDIELVIEVCGTHITTQVWKYWEYWDDDWTWLPTTGQLMQELRARKCMPILQCGQYQCSASYYDGLHPRRPEALGLVLLEVLEAQRKDANHNV